MKKILKFLVVPFFVSLIFISCEKKPLTLDKETPMKALLKASDKEIADLVVREAVGKGKIAEDEISVEYILRDAKTQTIVVKSNISTK
ncbi:MAG: hypothetical protein KBT11_07010 [Treponema sp.]|nr:hypothetical protein [Candidatus Treponema equifaecale]